MQAPGRPPFYTAGRLFIGLSAIYLWLLELSAGPGKPSVVVSAIRDSSMLQGMQRFDRGIAVVQESVSSVCRVLP